RPGQRQQEAQTQNGQADQDGPGRKAAAFAHDGCSFGEGNGGDRTSSDGRPALRSSRSLLRAELAQGTVGGTLHPEVRVLLQSLQLVSRRLFAAIPQRVSGGGTHLGVPITQCLDEGLSALRVGL